MSLSRTALEIEAEPALSEGVLLTNKKVHSHLGDNKGLLYCELSFSTALLHNLLLSIWQVWALVCVICLSERICMGAGSPGEEELIQRLLMGEWRHNRLFYDGTTPKQVSTRLERLASSLPLPWPNILA